MLRPAADCARGGLPASGFAAGTADESTKVMATSIVLPPFAEKRLINVVVGQRGGR
jgi:hypothetical protein